MDRLPECSRRTRVPVVACAFGCEAICARYQGVIGCMLWIASFGGGRTARRVKDLLSKDVFVLYADDNLLLAEAMMQWKCIRQVPVVDRRYNLKGLVTHCETCYAPQFDACATVP